MPAAAVIPALEVSTAERKPEKRLPHPREARGDYRSQDGSLELLFGPLCSQRWKTKVYIFGETKVYIETFDFS